MITRQREIVILAARGLTNSEIADRLFLSPRTVASHLYRSFPKLGIAGRHQLHDLIGPAVTAQALRRSAIDRRWSAIRCATNAVDRQPYVGSPLGQQDENRLREARSGAHPADGVPCPCRPRGVAPRTGVGDNGGMPEPRRVAVR